MVVGCQPYAPATFTPRKYSWYSFLLEAESTPGPWCDRKDYVNEKSTDTIKLSYAFQIMQILVPCDMSKSDNSIFQNNQDTWDKSYLAEHKVLLQNAFTLAATLKTDVLWVLFFS
jgi:hypothetical protein